MRRSKDNRQVPKRYYRPEQTTCPHCGQVLKRAYPRWRKYVVCLHGRYWIVNLAYRCPNPECVERNRAYMSPAAQQLTLRGSSFGLDVIVQIGYWRFWKRWTVTQIHEVLTQERHIPISEREVLYLIGVFLVLLRCTYPLRLAEHAAYFRRRGLFLSVDALKPEKGNTALYVVRELTFGLILGVTPLLSADHTTVAQRVLQPVKALGYRVRGVVSDDEKAMPLAVAHVWPGVAHQTCQLHCLQDAATPIEAADQTFKKALKKGAILSWINSWLWSNAATPSWRSTGASTANATGWWNWIGDLTRPKTLSRAQPGAVSSDTSRTRVAWPNWKSTPNTIPPRPKWSSK